MVQIIARKFLPSVGISLNDRPEEIEGSVEIVLLLRGKYRKGLRADLLIRAENDEQKSKPFEIERLLSWLSITMLTVYMRFLSGQYAIRMLLSRCIPPSK